MNTSHRVRFAPRVAIYARFISDLQRDASIEDQVRRCRGLVEREGWSVVETFTDFAMSGSSALRPSYQALLAAVRAGQVDVVVSESLDCLSRDQEHVAALHKQKRFAGVRIVTLSEGEVSELHMGLKGTMGALYIKDLVAAGAFWPVADGLLVVPPVCPAPAVPHNPRRGADAGPRGCGPGGQPDRRRARQPDGEGAVR